MKDKIIDFIAKRKTDRLEKFDKEAEKNMQTLSGEDLVVFELELQEKRMVEEKKYSVGSWLEDASARAKQISLVNHALKYTHSDAKGTSLMLTGHASSEYVGSRAVNHLTADVVGNAAALDVANFLLLEAGNKKLLDYIAAADSSPFVGLGSDGQIQNWLQGFAKALEVSAPASHTLAKQLYFPLPTEGYHLLAPLSATSFHQELYERIQHYRFSDDAKEQREFKKKGLYGGGTTRDFPHLATQTYGGTKPQNISLLNSKRGGKLYLFNAQPPNWKAQTKPPQSSEIFWREYRYRIRKTVKELQVFLEKVQESDKNNLSIRNKRAAYLEQMVDELHNLAANIWQFPENWSANSEIDLTLAERCWLDPRSTAPEVIDARTNKSWCETIAERFAYVLAQEIKTNKLLIADDEQSFLAKQLRKEKQSLLMDLEGL
ncbi:MAG: type I-F CRISPR-associated protein Csy1 [Venatoribacter sp.]